MKRFSSVSFGKLAFLSAALFFLAGLITLPHYGINWDTINHLPRGQAYLRYFLTRERDYSGRTEFFSGWQTEGQWYWQKEDTLFFHPQNFRPQGRKLRLSKGEIPRVSLYQAAGIDFNYLVENDGGHPPLSDIFSAFFNYVLFQKLGFINDIDSYRIYGVFLAAVLVGTIFWWTAKIYGKFAGFIAALSLSLYPLFWSESHFNTEKDIPETVYWSLFLFSLWMGVRKRSPKWTLLAGVLFGFALGTKFNIVFVPFVVFPWLGWVAYQNGWLKKPWRFLKKNKKFVTSLLLVPILGMTFLIAFWPYLWADPIARLANIVGFYKGIGLTKSINPRFTWIFGVNTYPLIWIYYTTPVVILVFSIAGFISAFRKAFKEKHGFSFLVLLWLAVPIIRVSLPGMTIYGGIRQIMEYIPALAILSGIGGVAVFNWLSPKWNKLLAGVIVAGAFLPIAYKLVSIHPNENVYFNYLAGGLAGAKERKIPYWGNSFGAAYRQGSKWINENAEKGANVVYANELIPNIPRIWLRTDLNLWNGNRSGYLRKGEYAITLTYEGTDERSYYDMYLEKFIEPVYQVKVDGVPILKVWKNDEEHLKIKLKEELASNVLLEKKDYGLRFDLRQTRRLSRLEIEYDERQCEPLSSGNVQVSKDAKRWEALPERLPVQWRVAVLGKQPKDGYFIEPFVGQEARYVELILSPEDTCLKNVQAFDIYYFKED